MFLDGNFLRNQNEKGFVSTCHCISGSACFANAYVGATYNRCTFDENGTIGDFGLNSLAINGGYKLNDIIAVEARIGFGLGDDTRNQQTAKLRNYLGLYAKAGIPLGGFYPYALLGFTRGNFRRSSNLAPNASTTATPVSPTVLA